MIRVVKPRRAPAVLRSRGRAETNELCQAFRRGARTFSFDREIYGAKVVKEALRKAQHDKCCFCEAKISHIAYGDVEHFRPKAGYRQHPNDPLSQPGYYWLAYEWTNLFLCCQLCNQRHKRNLFPLQNPARRARSHTEDIAKERALFIDPSRADPARYIGFRKEVAYAINGNAVGQATIDALQLNRPELRERRYERLELLINLKRCRDALAQELAKVNKSDGSLVKRLRSEIKRIDAVLEKHTRDPAEYAATLRAALV